jgi:serine O-acetyltransferase
MFDALTLYWLARGLHRRGVPLLPQVLRRATFHLFSSHVPYEAEIGQGTQLGYGGMGVVIHKGCRIGRHCLISQHVTIGGRSGLQGAPRLGDGVRVGAGAKILGPIEIGDFAVIGANAVVVHDVRPGAVVAGIPARELRVNPDPEDAFVRETGMALPPATDPERRILA